MKTLEDYAKTCDQILASTTEEVRKLLQRIKARDLYPHFLGRMVSALEALAAKGKLYWITQGERTWSEQDKLYAYGRTDMSRGIVTNAEGGSSVHNFSAAGDAAKDKDGDWKTGLQPSWDKPAMKEWADQCVLMNLEAGYYWKNLMDGPHVQLPLNKHGIKVKDLAKLYQKGGKLAVFQLFDTKDWSK